MAKGYPVFINGVHIMSSEALYQACRFPHLPNVQECIIRERKPISAKRAGIPFRSDTRPDWDHVRIKVMRWCLKVKLAQNYFEFGKLIESTFDKQIVEDSSKDDFWGAIRDEQNIELLKGTNALGRLLMELRHFYHNNKFSYEIFVVEPPDLPDFKLFGREIEKIDARDGFISEIKKRVRLNEFK